MSMTDLPAMLVSETFGWTDIDHAHRSRQWYFRNRVLPLSLLPPLLYVYAETMHPGAIFPLSVPALTAAQLLASALVFYCAELGMVAYLAMLIQRMAIARDHDPGDDGPYALATVASIPFWIGSLAMLVPSVGLNLLVLAIACIASIVLIRHGVRPLLHVADEKTAHYIADMATMTAVAVWIGFLMVSGLVLSALLVRWQVL